MAHKMPFERKRRTRAHVIADLSINHFERQALLCGSSVERVIHDYGIDLWIATYSDRGEIENGEIRVQVKATDRLQLGLNGRVALVRIDREDLVYWLEETMPVILVLYDARADVSYWLYVQAYLRSEGAAILKRAGNRVTVHIPTANVVDAKALKTFAEYRNQVLTQIRGVAHRG
jgi:hypothetical protein